MRASASYSSAYIPCLLTITLSLLQTRSAIAQNDWNTPCFSGVCQYDSPTAGNLKVWGSANAISDITTAAGWQILNCSADAMAQDIRLVCMGGEGCDNLYASAGAVGKIVRLPENCGKSAFARVAKAWVPEDQSMPSSVAARFVKRGRRSIPEVKALSLDTNFGAVDSTAMGAVYFAIDGRPDLSNVRRRDAKANRRSVNKRLDNNVSIDNSTQLTPVSFDKKFNVFNTSIGCAPDFASASVDVDSKADATVSLGVIANGTLVPPNVTQFEVTVGMTANLSGTVNMLADVTGSFDSGKVDLLSIPLGAFEVPGILTIGPTFDVSAQAKANLDVDLNVLVGLNYAISSGEFVFPPDGKQANGGFNIVDTPLQISVSPDVQSTGAVEAHIIPQLTLGISALDDSVTADVFIALDTSATLQLQLEASDSKSVQVPTKRTLGSSSTIRRTIVEQRTNDKSDMTPTKSKDSSSSSSEKMPSKVSPYVSEVHETVVVVSPSDFEYKLQQLVGCLSQCKYGGKGMIPPSMMPGMGGSGSGSSSSSSSSSMGSGSGEDRGEEGSSSTSTSTSTSTTSESSSTSSSGSSNDGGSTDSGSDANFGGCFEIKAGFTITTGASGKFFDLFDDSTQATLFDKQFELFKKCFGNQQNVGFTAITAATPPACPASTLSAAQTVESGVIDAADIKPLAA